MILRWWDFIDALFDFNYLIVKKITGKTDEETEDVDRAVDHYKDVKDLIYGLLKFAYNAS